MTAKYSLLPFLSVALSFSACSKVNDMHDATMAMSAVTAKMAATTEEMSANTKEIKSTSNGMNGELAGMYDSGRQGGSVHDRDDQWRDLVTASKPDEKASNAGLYFIEFEYQIWDQVGRDATVTTRERLMKDAAIEFFNRLSPITHWAPEEMNPLAGAAPALLQSPLKQADLDNEKASFNALAATLESVNRQEELVAEKFGQVSMLTMVETALKAGYQIRAGKANLKDFPAYVDVILQAEELAHRLLKARYQMMGVAVLCQTTTMCRDLGEGMKYTMLKQSWDLDLGPTGLNQSELSLISFRLAEAAHAKEVLESIGDSVALDSTVAAVFSRGNVKNALDPAAAGDRTDLAQLQAKVIGQIKAYSTGQ